MTTPGFGALSSAVARARNEIFRRHFDPTTLLPAAQVKASMQCLLCNGSLRYTASTDGRMILNCSSAGCIKWSD